jgi:hypothetical protein
VRRNLGRQHQQGDVPPVAMNGSTLLDNSSDPGRPPFVKRGGSAGACEIHPRTEFSNASSSREQGQNYSRRAAALRLSNPANKSVFLDLYSPWPVLALALKDLGSSPLSTTADTTQSSAKYRVFDSPGPSVQGKGLSHGWKRVGINWTFPDFGTSTTDCTTVFPARPLFVAVTATKWVGGSVPTTEDAILSSTLAVSIHRNHKVSPMDATEMSIAITGSRADQGSVPTIWT